MRLLKLVLLVAAMAQPLLAKDDISDWQNVKDIPPGWRISVVSGRHIACIFVRATDEELVCGGLQRGWYTDPREFHFRREMIREVRVDRGDAVNALAGAAVGGSLGAALGASNPHVDRGAMVPFFATIGAAIGLRAGRDCHIVRSKLLYQSHPSQKSRGQKAQPAATRVSAETTVQTSP